MKRIEPAREQASQHCISSIPFTAIMSYHQRESSRGDDDPPYSRLFILCSRGTSEDDFREAFGKYGTVQDVWILKDKQRNEDKGVKFESLSLR